MNIYQFIEKSINNKSIFFEIGSHFGIDTKKIFDLTGARIHCFEPDPRNVKIMEKYGIFSIAEKVNPVAVSNFNGRSDFYLSSGEAPSSFENIDLNKNPWSASSSLKRPKLHLEKTPWCKFDEISEVDCVTISKYCEDNNIEKIDFIWMDVQGAEDLVLRGMNNMAEKTRFIYTEYSDEELYENSLNKKGILDLLSSDWTVLYDFGSDVLLENTKFNNI